MKKRNMTLPKRLLAMSLSLAMCAGMVCTTAFAESASDDYVYVYINVKPDSVETIKAPEFEADDSAKQALDTAKSEVETAVDQVTEANKKLDGGAPEFKEPTADTNPPGQSNLDVAKGAVEGALEELTGVDKPEYKEATDTPAPDAQTDDQTPDPDTPAEPENKSFTDTVNDTIKELNDEAANTQGEVEAGKSTADEAAQAKDENGDDSTLAAEKAKLDAAAKEALDALNQARADAELAVEAANERTEAFNAKDFQKELDDAIAALEKPTNKPTAPTAPVAPVVENFETYEAYEAAFATYETARETYEADFETYQTKFKEYEDAVSKYNANVAQLKADHDKALADEKKAADDKVEAAKAQLQAAQAALDAFNAIKDKYGPGTEEIPGLDVAANSEVIQKYNDALKAYNDAVAGYNGKANAYNDAAGKYNNAVVEYDQAVDEYNKKVEGIKSAEGGEEALQGYNEKVTEYTKKVEAYEQAVDAYNGQVDSYNATAAGWNSGRTAENDKLEEVLKGAGVSAGDISVYREVNDKLSTSTSPAAEDGKTSDPLASLTNEQITAYNKVVNAYNSKVNEYNEKLVKDTLTRVEEYYNQDKWKGSTDAGGVADEAWYTVGKIKVGDILGNPANYKNSEDMYSTPAYSWDKDAEGNWTETKQDGTNLNTDSEEFKSFVAALGNAGNLTKDSTYANGADSEKSPAVNDVGTWLLHSTISGANTGAGGNYVPYGTASWHLDGTLRVQQLSQLATLQERAEKVQYETKTTVETKEHVGEYEKDPNTGKDLVEVENLTNGLKDADTYDPYQAVMMPNSNPQPEDEKPGWKGNAPTATNDVGALTRPDDVVADDPDQIVPGTPITPPPEGEGGGPGGGGGGGDTPVIDVPDPDVPLTDLPETPEEPEEEVIIPDEEVPLAETPDEVIIPDEEVPLAAVPQTGDISTAWYAVALTSACALTFVTLRRKEEED